MKMRKKKHLNRKPIRADWTKEFCYYPIREIASAKTLARICEMIRSIQDQSREKYGNKEA